MVKKTAILTGEACSPLLFRHVSPGLGDSTLQFRFIHFWEARKNVKGGPCMFLGIEMLMIDEEVCLPVSFFMSVPTSEIHEQKSILANLGKKHLIY